MAAPIRVLTAVPICDGHDSAINTINLEFIRHGIEVVYLGYHRYATDMVRAAIQEDVKALGISSYNGGHVEFFSEVASLLKKQGRGLHQTFRRRRRHDHGRGRSDYAAERRRQDFFRGDAVVDGHGRIRAQTLRRTNAKAGARRRVPICNLARKLTEIEDRYAGKEGKRPTSNAQRPTSKGRKGNERKRTRVFGFTGPGGAGKTTLIDELVLAPAASRTESADRDSFA